MENIIRKISLEPYITRFPVSWPSLEDGNMVYLDLYNNPEHLSMGNYGRIPLGINESILHTSYGSFTDEMLYAYHGKVLSYHTLQQWFNQMLSYKKILYSNECHGKFKTMEDYYANSYNGGMIGYAREQDELYQLHGGDNFYKWLTENYFPILDLNECYNSDINPEITSKYSYSEWQDVILNLGGPFLTFPEAFKIFAQMRVWFEKFDGKECKNEEECCDCVKYTEYGGAYVYGLLDLWCANIQSITDSNNADVDFLEEYERAKLYPTIDVSIPLKSKLNDVSAFEPVAKDFEPGHLYHGGEICIAEDNVWILSGDTAEYCEPKFISSGWIRYYDYYEDRHQDEFIDQEEIPNCSGRTVSSLDSFLRLEETVDGMGNTLPGYFRPYSGSTYIQPAENETLDLMYVPGTVINSKILVDNGIVKSTYGETGNIFTGDILVSIRFYCKRLNGNEYPDLSVTVFENNLPISAITWISQQMEIKDAGDDPTDGIIYADFKYYMGCTYTVDYNSHISVSGETYVECIDHCVLDKSTCQYHVSDTESYPLIYYNVIKDSEIRYSDERQDFVEVYMCDFNFKPSKFVQDSFVITPVFRREEMLPFSRVETPVDNIYIDRGYATVLDRHLRIGEINDYEQLEKYGNGIFQIFNADEEVV